LTFLGKPNPATFPFAKLAITLNGPEQEAIVLEGTALSEALQYGLPAGNASLIKVSLETCGSAHGHPEAKPWSFSGSKGYSKLFIALPTTALGLAVWATVAKS
jgi:tryptophan aminotransferase